MRILLVDDNAGLRDLFRLILEEHGHEVIAARDGLDAMERLGGLHYDVIVTDMNMPGMTGCELFHKARELRPEIPVILTSGMEAPTSCARCAAGRFIHKTELPDRLPALLDDVVGAAGASTRRVA